MKIEKQGRLITSVTDWQRLAPPKRPEHWTAGRSAYELARAWCGTGKPAMPGEISALLDSRTETRSLHVECAHPEHRIPFDQNGGEPRNADLAFLGQTPAGPVAVTVEAKADEEFGDTVADTLGDALERLIQNERSQGVRRVEGLVRALFAPRQKGLPHVGSLRYQLLTAVAGSLAYAEAHKAPTAVLIIHEFITAKTTSPNLARNASDLGLFLHRLSGARPPKGAVSGLLGPFHVPGSPAFSPAVALFVGKVDTLA